MSQANIRSLLAAVAVLMIAGCGLSPQEAQKRGNALYGQEKYAEAHKYLERAFQGGVEHGVGRII